MDVSTRGPSVRRRARRLRVSPGARRPGNGEAGVALVEFALVLPLLLLLVFGLLDFGRALSYWLDEKHLAHQGGRWAAVATNPGAPGQTLQQYIRGQAETDEMRDNLIVCVDWQDVTPVAGEFVRVRTEVTFTWLEYIKGTLGIPTTITLKGSSTQRMEQDPGTVYSPANNPAGC